MSTKTTINKLRRAYGLQKPDVLSDSSEIIDIQQHLIELVPGCKTEYQDGAIFAYVSDLLCCAIDCQETRPVIFLTAECPSTIAIRFFDALYGACSARPVIGGTFYTRGAKEDIYFDEDAYELFILDQATQMVNAEIKTSATVDTKYLLTLLEKTDAQKLN